MIREGSVSIGCAISSFAAPAKSRRDLSLCGSPVSTVGVYRMRCSHGSDVSNHDAGRPSLRGAIGEVHDAGCAASAIGGVLRRIERSATMYGYGR
jgi:hypothetical protein